jgi:hypothetical protein
MHVATAKLPPISAGSVGCVAANVKLPASLVMLAWSRRALRTCGATTVGCSCSVSGHCLGLEEGGGEGARMHVGDAVELTVPVHLRVNWFARLRFVHDGPMLSKQMIAPAYLVLVARSWGTAGMDGATPLHNKHAAHESWRGGKRRLVGPPAR